MSLALSPWVASSGVIVLLTYVALAVYLLSGADSGPFTGGLSDRARLCVWYVSTPITVAAYLQIAVHASDEVVWALLAFNICATGFAPAIILDSRPGKTSLFDLAHIAVYLTALASVAVALVVVLYGDGGGLDIAAAAWLVVHHVIVDGLLWSGILDPSE